MNTLIGWVGFFWCIGRLILWRLAWLLGKILWLPLFPSPAYARGTKLLAGFELEKGKGVREASFKLTPHTEYPTIWSSHSIIWWELCKWLLALRSLALASNFPLAWILYCKGRPTCSTAHWRTSSLITNFSRHWADSVLVHCVAHGVTWCRMLRLRDARLLIRMLERKIN